VHSTPILVRMRLSSVALQAGRQGYACAQTPHVQLRSCKSATCHIRCDCGIKNPDSTINFALWRRGMASYLLRRYPLETARNAAIAEAHELVRGGYDRRKAFRTVGLLTAGVIPLFWRVEPAIAASPWAAVAVKNLIVPACKRGFEILCTAIFENWTEDFIEGPVRVQHKEPSGVISEQGRIPVALGPGEAGEYYHDGFLAKTIGENMYVARAENDRGEEYFDVFEG
jgi:hypothetical protein